MVDRRNEIKKYFDHCSKNIHNRPQDPIIRYYSDQFLNGEINSLKLYSLLKEKGLFQSEKFFTKTHDNDLVNIINSDDELRKIIRNKIYRSATLKEKINKKNSQPKIISGGRKRRGKRSKKSLYPSAPKKIANDDPKIKKEVESREALLRELEEKTRKDLEMALNSKKKSDLNENFQLNNRPFSSEEKEVLDENDQYRKQVSEKQKKYWGSF